MEGTDCFDPKTLEMLTKLAQCVSRDMTPEAFNEIVQGGLLRPYLAALQNPELVADLISVTNGETVISGPGVVGDIELESDGRSGAEWIEYFEGKISPGARRLLLSPAFVPTSGVRYKVRIAPGRRMPNSITRTPHGVRFGSKQDKPLKTSFELACLLVNAMNSNTFQKLCSRLSGGQGIVAIHQPDIPDAPRKRPENRYLVATFGRTTEWGSGTQLIAYHMNPLTNFYLFAYCIKMRLPD